MASIDGSAITLIIPSRFQYLTPEGARYQRRTEELFSCLQKLVIASMTIGLIGLGVAFVFLLEYIAGW